MTKVGKNTNPHNNNFLTLNACRFENNHLKRLLESKESINKDLYHIIELQKEKIARIEKQVNQPGN